jgi:deoxyribonuclease V
MDSLSHNWNVSPKEAVEIQKKLQNKVKLQPLEMTLGHKIRTIAGADISFNRFEDDVYAGFIVLSYPDLKEIARSLVKSTATFPYIPGLLSFREIPSLLEAWEKLQTKPDLVVVDGQGIAHPRRLGIASHFGIIANVPTIGSAKSLLTGTFDEPAASAGSLSSIHDRYKPDEIIGAAIRTKVRSKPIIVSPGHLITMEESISIMLECGRGYRIPEPTRLAHEMVNEFRRSHLKKP